MKKSIIVGAWLSFAMSSDELSFHLEHYNKLPKVKYKA